jgi:hypothetical protein
MNLYFLNLISSISISRRESVVNGRLPNGEEERMTNYPLLGMLILKNGDRKVTIEYADPLIVRFYNKKEYMYLEENWELTIGNRHEVVYSSKFDLVDPFFSMFHLTYIKRLLINHL